MRIMRTWFLLTIATVGARPALGQSIELRVEPSCEECVIRFEVRDTLGGTNDPASPGPTAEAVRLTDGRVLVSSPTVGPEVLVYTAGGAFVRVMGRKGEGPGEFVSAPNLVVLPGDTIAALDAGAGRVTLFTPEGGFVTALNVGMGVLSLAPVADGRFLISGLRTDAHGLEGLHVVTRAGRIERSFGGASIETGDTYTVLRKLAIGPGGHIWSAALSGGVVEEWSVEGDLLRSYQIMEPGLQKKPVDRVDFSRERPPAQITDLATDSEGRVWIYVVVPDPAFEPGPSSGPRSPRDIYDTNVLILDPSQGRVTVSGRFDRILRPLGDGWAYDLVDTELGDRRVRVGTLDVRGPEATTHAPEPGLGGV